MLGHRGLAELEVSHELADRALGRAEKLEDAPSIGLNQDFKDGHGSNITHVVYNCQAMIAPSMRRLGSARA